MKIQPTTRKKIVELARKYKGVPFRHQGRSIITGVDCAGLVVCIIATLGYQYKEDLRYGRNAEKFTLKKEMDLHLCKIKKHEIQPGDILLMKIDRVPQHVAIVSDYVHGGLGMIHCYDRVKKVVEHRLANVWKARIVQAYEMPDLQEDK